MLVHSYSMSLDTSGVSVGVLVGRRWVGVTEVKKAIGS